MSGKRSKRSSTIASWSSSSSSSRSDNTSSYSSPSSCTVLVVVSFKVSLEAFASISAFALVFCTCPTGSIGSIVNGRSLWSTVSMSRFVSSRLLPSSDAEDFCVLVSLGMELIGIMWSTLMLNSNVKGMLLEPCFDGVCITTTSGTFFEDGDVEDGEDEDENAVSAWTSGDRISSNIVLVVSSCIRRVIIRCTVNINDRFSSDVSSSSSSSLTRPLSSES